MKDQNIGARCLRARIALVLLFICPFAYGQRLNKDAVSIGLLAHFGGKQYTLTSNIDKLHQLPVSLEGGSAGVTVAAYGMSIRADAGFYYANARTKFTFDQFQSGASVSIFPMNLGKPSERRIRPYVSGGIAYSELKFSGRYLPQEQPAKQNYSAPEPYLGKSRITELLVGAGIQYHFRSCDFLALFLEAQQTRPFSFRADQPFLYTAFDRAHSVSVGIIFGRKALERY